MHSTFKSLGVLGVILLLTTGANAATINVPSQYPTIQAAISASVSGDTIIVAPGTYRQSFTWYNKDLTIRGAGEGLSIIEPSGVGIYTFCAFVSGLTSASRLEGFTLQNANSSDEAGGMTISASHLTVSRCTFKNNVSAYGGGMFISNTSNPTITDCTFAQNESVSTYFQNNGGGISIQENCNPIIRRSTFLGNKSRQGGGIYVNPRATPQISKCTFIDNIALNSSDNTESKGGGIYLRGTTSTRITPRIADCTFQNNTAYRGGGIYHFESNATLTNCQFMGNQATDKGGGIYQSSSDSTFTNCAFQNNTAGVEGGALANLYDCNPVLTNCIFTGNQGQYGGAVYSQSYSPVVLTNCTIVGNQTDGNGAIYVQFDSDLTLTNCIVWGNGSALLLGANSDLILSNSLVQDLANSTPDSSGNFAADPLFVDAANGDFHLKPGSPAAEAGNSSALPLDTQDLDGDGDTTELLPIDFDGNVRVKHSSIDLGAYEYQEVLNVTGKVQITRGGLRRNNATGRYLQTITLKNGGTQSLTSISLVLDSLSTGVALFNAIGTTSDSLSPYLNLAGTLAPGASITLTLEFTNPSNKAINYTARILAGDGIR